MFPRQLPKHRLLYGFHRVRDSRDRRVALVEGVWEVLRLAQIGVGAVALMGTRLSDHQAELLQRWAEIVLLLDGDAAGRRATDPICGRLRAVPVYPPMGRDPEDLSDEALIGLLPS